MRLVNAKAPTAPIAAQGDRPWPMVNEAKEALSKLASGAEVELRYGGTRTDRHGYALLQVYVVKGGERIWLQSELVGKGLARVYSFPDNHACVSELLAREAEARAKGRRGLGVLAYRVLAADNVERLGRLTRSYQLVEGVVAQVGVLGTRLSQLRQGLAEGFHRADRAQGRRSLQGRRHRSKGARRKEAQGARVDRVAEQADDPRDPRRADRALARWRRLAATSSRGSGGRDRALSSKTFRPGTSRA